VHYFISHLTITCLFSFQPSNASLAAYLVHMMRGRVKMEKMSYRWMRDERRKFDMCISAPRCYVHQICSHHRKGNQFQRSISDAHDTLVHICTYRIWSFQFSSNHNSSFFVSTLPRGPGSTSGAMDAVFTEIKKKMSYY
jgi:hypothetical protein